jgi:hypothetical protein
LVASFYADDTVHVSAFFREPQPTAEYAAWAFSDEQEAEVWFAEPVVEGNRAAVAWWAISRGVDGRDTTLAGILDLRLGPDRLVIWQRDYWNSAEDAATPPPGDWGPRQLTRAEPRPAEQLARRKPRTTKAAKSSSPGSSARECQITLHLRKGSARVHRPKNKPALSPTAARLHSDRHFRHPQVRQRRRCA